uniref:Insulin-like growth factor binding protein 6a n=1 Tax=Salarias fasciatus TaxID=181472 RepID=A0A672GPD7_SALFA
MDNFSTKMLLCLNILVLLLLQTTLSSPVTTPPRGCPTCRGNQSQSAPPADQNTTTLALGEACGVYTLSCANGLRCAPPEEEQKPLRALLEGRGVCRNASSTTTTTQVYTVDTRPTDDPNEVKAPCRKLLRALITGLDAHVFESHPEIYMPNCDKRGFFRKKQCLSSRGMKRGKCWCVDENGMLNDTNWTLLDNITLFF